MGMGRGMGSESSPTPNPKPKTPMPSIQQPVGAMGSTGYLIYDTNTPGVIGPAVINAYTTLCIPAYWRAMDFLTKNLTCFPRSIRREEVAVKHRLLKLLTRRPNTYQNSTLFWGTLYFHWSHYHNAFAWIERDSQFNPIALHNRIPEMVAPFRYLDDDANPEQAADDVVKWTFRPLVEQVEDELSLKLLSESDQDAGLKVHLDTNCLIRGDRETQSNIVTQQKAAGILTPNEARQEIGLPASDHPDADALKTAGDTAAQKPVADPDAAANKN